MSALAFRDPEGRFLPGFCTDPNCDGILQADIFYGRPVWICNGLTHDSDAGELRACERSYDRSARMTIDQGVK